MQRLLLTVGWLLTSCIGPICATEPNTTKRDSGIDLDNISGSISPGKDFYEYVNEGWLEETEIPADRSNFGSFSVLDDETKAAIRQIIEEAAAEEDAAKGSDSQKVGDFFRSYMNIDRRNELGVKPIQALLDEVEAISNPSDLSASMASLMRNGVYGAFAYYVSPDARKSDQYTIYAVQSGLSLPDRDYYLEDTQRYEQAREELVKYIADMLSFVDHESPEDAAKLILAMETKLAEYQWTREESRDPVKGYNKFTQEELIEEMNNFDIPRMLDTAGIAQQQEFIVRQPSFFQGINDLVSELPLDTWKDYYTYQIIDTYGDALSEEIEARHFAFHGTVLSGVEQQKPLWRRGVEATEGVMGEIVGRLYVEQHFPPQAKERMGELVDNLKRAFAKRIDALDWMTPVTKKEAHDKLAKFTTKIGYPDKWKDYSKLEIEANDLVGNYMRAAGVEYQRQIDKLGGPIDRTEWGMTPQTINAYYNPVMNEIVFPAAILQPPFFNMEADDAVNYGGIGAVIGHEISHGFDDKGSQYDGNGNLRNWWSPQDREEFERRAQELVEQYSSYKPFDDMNVNGEFTLGENIGDLGGLSVAYEAYRMSLGGEEAPVIKGLTGDQRFFMGWAQIWRRLYREPELRKRLLTDPHSPSRYRCNGIVSNIDAFYEAFSIKPEDKMYIAPEDRVRIW